MRRELEVFQEYLKSQSLKLTRSRRLIAETLLAAKRHLSPDDLLETLRRNRASVSKATVYRTLAIMRRSQHFDAHDFGLGKKFYEPMLGRPHHDHLCCIGCGEIIEFQEPRIEHLQDQVVAHHGFTPVYHTHKIFGYCARCSRGQRPK